MVLAPRPQRPKLKGFPAGRDRFLADKVDMVRGNALRRFGWSARVLGSHPDYQTP